jgi:hypothetical protein
MKLFYSVIDFLGISNHHWEYVGTIKTEGACRKGKIKVKYYVDDYIIDSLIKKIAYTKGNVRFYTYKPVYVNGKTFKYKGVLKHDEGFEQGWNPLITFKIYRKLQK